MREKPKISVVIFSYNFERYLPECIESILNQTLLPIEIVICDDHSDDNSWAIIEKYKQKYPEIIRNYRHASNIGSLANGNFGGSIYKGDWVTLIDGDDRWLPRKLEFEWKAIQNHPAARIAYSNVYNINEEGERIKIWYDNVGPKPPSGDVFSNVLSRSFFPNSKSVYRNELVHRSVFQKEGQLDESLESYWDWDRKIRYSAKFCIVYSGEATVEYRDHRTGFHVDSPEKHHRAMIQIYEKNAPLFENRPKEEQVWIKCNIEEVIAVNHDRYFPYQEGKYAVTKVYERINKMLCLLNKDDRAEIKKFLAQSDVHISFLFRVLRTELKNGNLKLVLKYLKEIITECGLVQHLPLILRKLFNTITINKIGF